MGKIDHKRRVLFICPQPFFEWRGSPIRVKFTLLALSQLGYQVDLLTLPIGQREDINNVKVIRTINLFGAKKIAPGPSLLKLWFDFVLLIHSMKLVLTNRYDVLHGTEEAGFICYLLSLICRAKCVFEKHSDSNSYKPKFLMKPVLAVYQAIERLTVKRCQAVISTGPALDEQARSWITSSNAANKFSMIPDIPSSTIEADVSTVTEVRAKLVQNPEHVIVTYGGSFASYQGLDIIFDAIPKIAQKNDLARFVIIGGSDKEIAFYKKQLAEHNITDEVQFLGKISPDLLPNYLAASDILLAPRKSGINSPLKILDYFKASTAIVATNTVANRRLLNKDNAILCEFDVDDFTNAISELINAPDKRNKLGQNAHQLYKSKYNFTTFKAQLNDTYKTLFSQN